MAANWEGGPAGEAGWMPVFSESGATEGSVSTGMRTTVSQREKETFAGKPFQLETPP